MSSTNQPILTVDKVNKTFLIPEVITNTFRESVFSFNKQKKYREYQVLRDISFMLNKGEFLGILGANGSGKSTLLKIIAGIYGADSGSVSINGPLVPFLELGVGFNPELTGRENIYLNGIILGMTKKEIDKKFQAIVDFSELKDFLDLKLKNYSSGMQVRLAFAIAIHVEADIYILDEVLAVGDFRFQNKCLAEFKRLRQKNASVIFVSHSAELVKNICDRAIWLNNGIIAAEGNPEDVLNLYQSYKFD